MTAMRRLCILTIAIVTPPIAYGQSLGRPERLPTIYREAVLAYQRGDVDKAADAVVMWPPEYLRRAISALVDDHDERLSESAVMLHTEIVLRGKATTKAAVSLHVTLAQAVVDKLQPAGALTRHPLLPDIAAFQRRWYALIGSFYLARTDPTTATVYIDRGLHLFNNDARLHMLAGTADEMRTHIADGNLHDREVIHLPAMSPARRTLLFAESRYRRALEFDPALEEARLRLGRVLSLRNDLKGARLEFEPLARNSALPRIRYLAHLFLGAVAEYQNDLAAARVEYLDALSIGPDCQTPYIALTFVEQAMGYGDSARELMARYAALSKDTTPDPWWAYQNGEIDAESLVWLRQQAMR
jgi:tetratricopeptide (TPR) repeat protein